MDVYLTLFSSNNGNLWSRKTGMSSWEWDPAHNVTHGDHGRCRVGPSWCWGHYQKIGAGLKGGCISRSKRSIIIKIWAMQIQQSNNPWSQIQWWGQPYRAQNRSPISTGGDLSSDVGECITKGPRNGPTEVFLQGLVKETARFRMRVRDCLCANLNQITHATATAICTKTKQHILYRPAGVWWLMYGCMPSLGTWVHKLG